MLISNDSRHSKERDSISVQFIQKYLTLNFEYLIKMKFVKLFLTFPILFILAGSSEATFGSIFRFFTGGNGRSNDNEVNSATATQFGSPSTNRELNVNSISGTGGDSGGVGKPSSDFEFGLDTSDGRYVKFNGPVEGLPEGHGGGEYGAADCLLCPEGSKKR